MELGYDIIEKNTWKTTLSKCDCESCFLSTIVPCHVYSKIVSTTPLEYTTHIILYIVLYTGIQQLMYIKYVLDKSVCPSNVITNCIFSQQCGDNYMLIKNKPYQCRYVEGFCVYDEYQCIQEFDTATIYVLSFLLYIMLTYLHYSARKYIAIKNNIKTDCVSDCCAITCASCGLAQEYRELP
jgi:uncharacterized membrane protein